MTITLERECNGNVVNISGVPTDTYWLHNSLYAIGELPPRYPVPAIPIEFEWYPDPLLSMIVTIAVDDTMLSQRRYYTEAWRWDGYPDFPTWD